VFLGRITLRITRWSTSRVDPNSYTTSGDVNPLLGTADCSVSASRAPGLVLLAHICTQPIVWGANT
jgi:hypothetical protein